MRNVLFNMQELKAINNLQDPIFEYIFQQMNILKWMGN